MMIDYNGQLDKLARVFNEKNEGVRVVPTKPDDPTQPISLPPSKIKNFYSQLSASEVVEQRKSSITKNTQPNPPQSSFTKEKIDKKKDIEQQLSQSLVVKHEQEQEQVEQGGEILEGEVNSNSIGARGSNSIGARGSLIDVDEYAENEKLSPTSRRGRPKGSRNKCASGGSRNKKTLEQEKLSRATNLTNLGESKKLSKRERFPQPLPVNIDFSSQTGVKGKTSLCYALLYSANLSPHNIALLLESQEELKLTSAEVIALSLIDRTTKGDPKAEKIYWDLLKNQAKNDKITPVKSENTLLDDALAKAENAIFGEIVVDNPEQP